MAAASGRCRRSSRSCCSVSTSTMGCVSSGLAPPPGRPTMSVSSPICRRGRSPDSGPWRAAALRWAARRSRLSRRMSWAPLSSSTAPARQCSSKSSTPNSSGPKCTTAGSTRLSGPRARRRSSTGDRSTARLGSNASSSATASWRRPTTSGVTSACRGRTLRTRCRRTRRRSTTLAPALAKSTPSSRRPIASGPRPLGALW